MKAVINRAAWSEEERLEFDELLAVVVASSSSSTERLDLMDRLVTDAIQAHRPWASDVARASRREGFGREIRRFQDRQRVPVSYDGQVMQVPAVQGRRVADGSFQRELIELWTWDELDVKRREAITASRTYSAKVAHYDRLLALRVASPDSKTPAEAAAALGVDLGEWLGRAA